MKTSELIGPALNWAAVKASVNDCAGIPTYQLTAENDNPTNLGEVIDAIRNQRDELLDAVTRCYKMLLSEPDTQGALFKAENILREAIADAN